MCVHFLNKDTSQFVFHHLFKMSLSPILHIYLEIPTHFYEVLLPIFQNKVNKESGKILFYNDSKSIMPYYILMS